MGKLGGKGWFLDLLSSDPSPTGNASSEPQGIGPLPWDICRERRLCRRELSMQALKPPVCLPSKLHCPNREALLVQPGEQGWMTYRGLRHLQTEHCILTFLSPEGNMRDAPLQRSILAKPGQSEKAPLLGGSCLRILTRSLENFPGGS